MICDQRVMLNGFYPAKAYPEHLRRVRFKDPESGKTLVFLTNNASLPPLTIAALHKKEPLAGRAVFKWIKRFLGTSENAVKTQIWCAVAILPSSRRSFIWMRRSTHVYISCRFRCSRKSRFHAPCGPIGPKQNRHARLTNSFCLTFNRTLRVRLIQRLQGRAATA